MIPFHVAEDEVIHGYMNCSSYVTMKQMSTLVPPILLLVGTLGNLLSLLVLTQESMRKLAVYNYLAVLSVADTLVLYSGVFVEWLRDLYGYSISQPWLCKLNTVIRYTASQYSVWIIVAVTVERYIAIAHTLRAVGFCTRRKAAIVMLTLFMVLLTLNGHTLFTATVKHYDESTTNTTAHQGNSIEYQCGFSNGTYIRDIWPWVDACFYSLLPFAVILSLNILIIRSVHQSDRQRRTMGSITSTDSNAAHRESEAKMTRILITISFVFLLTTLPVNIAWLVQRKGHLTFNEPCKSSDIFLAVVIGRMLMYTNHSINFFLYLFSGIKFREKLFSMFSTVGGALTARRHHVYGLAPSNCESNATSTL